MRRDAELDAWWTTVPRGGGCRTAWYGIASGLGGELRSIALRHPTRPRSGACLLLLDRARVFFSSRDEADRSQIGACTLDLRRLEIVPGSVTARPLLAPGDLGAFDDSGCSVACVVRDGGHQLLYYTGWMRGRSVPFYLAVGLALSTDDGATFVRTSRAPLLERTDVDPFLTASPSVLRGPDGWRMWYVSATGWENLPAGPRHHYLIKYAESADGFHWRREGKVALNFDEEEFAFGRPHVVFDQGRYRMWFCSRGASYRLGYAESADGLSWQRMTGSAPGVAPLAGPPPQQWDQEMQAYPMVFRDAGRWLMLYNGNGYGATGFGCAMAAED